MDTHKYKVLATFPIFNNLNHIGIEHVLNCLQATEKQYKKGDVIYSISDNVEYAGIVIEGFAKASTFNLNGDEYNIRTFEKGNLFGECFAFIPEAKMLMQVSAQTNCKILFLKLSNLTMDYAVNCKYASQVTVNLLKIVASNNIFQVRKTEIVQQKKIRDKLIMFLKSYKTNGNIILLPFNRQELANYLGVERSALSREMSKMKSEGLLDYNKNEISLLHSFYV